MPHIPEYGRLRDLGANWVTRGCEVSDRKHSQGQGASGVPNHHYAKQLNQVAILQPISDHWHLLVRQKPEQGPSAKHPQLEES